MTIKHTGFDVTCEDGSETVSFQINDDGIQIMGGWLGSGDEVCEAIVALRMLALTLGWETHQDKLARIAARVQGYAEDKP